MSDITQSFFTGRIYNKLSLLRKDNDEQYLMVLLIANMKGNREVVFKLEIKNAEALHFKAKVAKGDYVAITAEPYSYPDTVGGRLYITVNRIVSYQVLKKKEVHKDE